MQHLHGMAFQLKWKLPNSLTGTLFSTSCPFRQPWEREGGDALLVKGSPLQPQRGWRMLPLFLSVPRSWLMLAAFYLLVYRHSAGLSFVTGNRTNLRCAAGHWEQLSGGWRHLHPPSTRQDYTEQTERQSFMVRGTELDSLKRQITWPLEVHRF